MRFVIIGADHEENLGIGYIGAAAAQAGHAVTVVPFDRRQDAARIAQEIAARAPEVVGLSMQFQHRAVDFMLIAELLRRQGFRGHITCGGHLPSLTWPQLLRDASAIDSVVLFEGEETVVDLLSAIDLERSLAEVTGLALRRDDGTPFQTALRPLCTAIEDFPQALRYRGHAVHQGVPFIPVLGGRGCWGSCAFCSITTFYREAKGKKKGGGAYRLRDVADLADEMARLYHTAGGGLFCFHDDNFLMPRPQESLERLRELRLALDERGVGQLGMIGKCRPDSLTPELARELRALGVIRLYVGVENAAEAGLIHLNRNVSATQVRQALDACAAADIFACYNLLLFEPEACLDDVRDNISFMRDNAHHPVNFCRAEPYVGTPLHNALQEIGQLEGDYRSWNYRIADDRTELLFRIASAAFRQRNFAEDGVANRSMSLGYSSMILKHFYGGPEATALDEAAVQLTERVVLDTATHLEEALDLAATVDLDDRDTIERYTATLGLRIASADVELAFAMHELTARMEQLVAARGGRWRREDAIPTEEEGRGKARELVRKALAGAALGVGVVAGAASVVDPLPPPDGGYTDDAMTADAQSDAGSPDYMVVDPAPNDAGSPDYMVVDPAPNDAGSPDYMVVDPAPNDAGSPDYMVVDPPPLDAGGQEIPPVVDPAPWDAGSPDYLIVDPPPPDAGAEDVPPVVDPPPPDSGALGAAPVSGDQLLAALRKVSRPYAARSQDLPMHAPPSLVLAVSGAGQERLVRVHGVPEGASVRYEVSGGAIEGEGSSVAWRGATAGDQVRVAVRASGGVAVVHSIAS